MHDEVLLLWNQSARRGLHREGKKTHAVLEKSHGIPIVRKHEDTQSDTGVFPPETWFEES